MTIFALRSPGAPVQFLTIDEACSTEKVLASVNFTNYTLTEIPSIYTDTSVELTTEFCKLCYAIEGIEQTDAFWAFVDWLVAEIDRISVKREEVESWLHKYFAETLPVPEVVLPKQEYVYRRRCSKCQTTWGQNKITAEVFENALNNPAITAEYGENEYAAVLMTHCPVCK